MPNLNKVLIIPNINLAPEDDQALAQVTKFSEKQDLQIKLMHVISKASSLLDQYEDIISVVDIEKIHRKQAQEKLDKAAEFLRKHKIHVETAVVTGHDFIEIIRDVLINEQQFVIKNAEIVENKLSGTDLHLLRKCPSPVWLIRPGRPFKLDRILIALDPEQDKKDDSPDFNVKILELGITFSKWFDAEIKVLCCWDLYGESTLRSSPFLNISSEQIAKIIKRQQSYIEDYMNEFLDQHPSDRITKVIRKGDPKKIIPDFVNEFNIDTVVMGTVGRTGIPGFLIGNTAEEIVQKIHSSIITTKPDGFKTPVQG